jgi:antitoxin YefM
MKIIIQLPRISTEANRQHLKEAIELLKNPDNYIYVDPAKL